MSGPIYTHDVTGYSGGIRSGELQPASRSSSSAYHVGHNPSRTQADPSTSYYIPNVSGYQSPPVYGQPMRPEALSQEFKEKRPSSPPVLNVLERVFGLMDFTNVEVWRGTVVELVGVAAFEFALITGIAACVESKFKQQRVAVALVYFFVWSACMLSALLLWVRAGHLNPIFTYVSMLTGHMTVVRAMLYMIAQSIGAIIGAYAAKQIVQKDFINKNFLAGCLLGETVRTPHGLEWPEGLGTQAGLISEISFTFILIFVAYSTLIQPANFIKVGPFTTAISLGATLGVLTFISSLLKAPYYTGAGMNPARCLGPAIVIGSTLWDCHWIFWAGPFIAATVFALVFRIVFGGQSPSPTSISFHGGDGGGEFPFQQQPGLIPTSGGVGVGSGGSGPAQQQQQQQQQDRRMDVFLHIKAMMHRSESQRERSRSRSRNLLLEEAAAAQQQQVA